MLCQKSKQGKSCIKDSLHKTEWSLDALGTNSICNETKTEDVKFDFTNDLQSMQSNCWKSNQLENENSEAMGVAVLPSFKTIWILTLQSGYT